LRGCEKIILTLKNEVEKHTLLPRRHGKARKIQCISVPPWQ